MDQTKTTIERIDFTPLNIEKSFILKSPKTSVLVVILLILFILITVLSSISVDLMVISVILLFIAIGGVWANEYAHYAKLKIEALERFATINNFLYSTESKSWGSGSLFTHGHTKSMKNVIAGTLQDLPFRFYSYSYTQGSGKNKRTYDVVVMDFTLPRNLSHMVIDSLVEPDNQMSSTLPIQFDGSQKIDLEGDFHEYFALYAPESYGVTALSILAPDVMETLMRHASLCDIEIIDNKLYFYWPNTDISSKEIRNKFITVEAVLAEIGKKLTRGDVFSHPAQARVHSTPSPGVRLKKSSLKPIVVIAVLLYAAHFFISLSSPEIPNFFGLIVVGSIGWAIWKSRQKTKLKKALHRRFNEGNDKANTI